METEQTRSMNSSGFGKTGNSIYNDRIRQYLSENLSSWMESSSGFSDMHQSGEYLSVFLDWISSSKYNSISGTESFEYCDPSLGVTQSLDQFHYDILSTGRRLRMFRGEYPYSRDVHPFNQELDFLDDHPLKAGDAVILSLPFSGTGRPHVRMHEILEECHKMDVPLFLDMAWFGTCRDIEVDLSHPGINQVAFSLTKGLTCGNYRSGIRLTRQFLTKHAQDRLHLQHEWNHGIHLNCFIGKKLMQQFSPDTQVDLYLKHQLDICQDFEVEPSNCVHIATSNDSRWAEYDRDGIGNRLNLRDLIRKSVRSKP